MPTFSHCEACGKEVQNMSGLTRHRAHCKPVKSKHARKHSLGVTRESDHRSTESDDNSSTELPNHQSTELDDDHTIEQWEELRQGIFREGLWLQDLEGTGGAESHDQLEEEDTLSQLPNIELGSRSRLSTAHSIRTETFAESTGHKAGQPVGGSRVDGRTHGAAQTMGMYSPFSSAMEYALVQWFLAAKVSKGDTNRFFQDPRLIDIHGLLSFNNYDTMISLIHAIPYGIKDDKWRTSTLIVPSPLSDVTAMEYKFRYRDVKRSLEFLLGHPPFAEHLTYAPIRQYDGASNNRIYNEFHTADWWWETQLKLPEDATIVPLLLATDKTMLTMHHGDESCWPIYLTIGNLDREIRRRQSVPGSILLGEIPITKGSGDSVKAHIYHGVMGKILQPLIELSKVGFNVRCADGFVRRCYPIIAGMCVDYEEQVLITGIKQGRQCSICTVPADMREKLSVTWPKRTHETTQAQLQQIRLGRIKKRDDKWVHDIKNFAWEHLYVNIHRAMMIDILHQLLKGMVMHLLDWTRAVIDEHIVPSRKRKNYHMALTESSGSTQLDQRFRCVPYFTGLKRFDCFSKITQWTGDEQKAIIRQLIPVIAPLLVHRYPDALHCARAIIDFIILAMYKSHDESTLQYLQHAIYRIDKTKEAFRTTREGQDGKPGHFNFPKFHVMSHYVDFIREYGSADGVTTCHSEAGHKYHVKDFYGRTNKGESYFDQILLHNLRRLNAQAMDNILFYQESAPGPGGRGQIEVQVTRPSREVELTKFGWEISEEELFQVEKHHLNVRHWRRVAQTAQWANIPDFVDALAVFVRESRNTLAGVRVTNAELDRREKDPSWVEDMLIVMHPSMHCWRREGRDSSNLERLTEEIVRCVPQWHKQKGWRRDYVWVQEHIKTHDQVDGKAFLFDGRMVGQVQIIITVLDPENVDNKGSPVRYTGALVRLLRIRGQGKPHQHHGMVEVEEWPASTSMNRRSLGAFRFYNMTTILRSAHIVPADKGIYYINNYIDWDQYNDIYDPDFLARGIREADAIERRYHRQAGPQSRND